MPKSNNKKQGGKNGQDIHEKRLAKKREKRRAVLDEETPEEKQYRLAKRRADYKRRNETSTGKEREKQREERRPLSRQETAKQRESRLAKRRAAYKRRVETTTGVKQRATVLESETSTEHHQSENTEVRTGNVDCSDEVIDHRNEYLHTGQVLGEVSEYINKSGEKDGPDHEEIERIVSFCEELASIIYSVPEEGEESGSVPEPQGVSKNEYLHEGGWQNVDNPLHEQEFVQNEMHSFHLDQERLEHRQCTTCKEAWPTRQNLTSETYTCYRCKRDKKSPKKFSAENDMDPGIVPEQLRGLTQVEEMLISRVCPIMRVYRKHGGQRGYKGHVLNLPQDVQSFLNRLPSQVADLPVMVVRRHGADDTHKDFTVRRHRVLEALLWLKTNNPFFKDIEIDRQVIQSLPENGVPDELRYVIDDNEPSVHVENEGPPQEPTMSANASVEELILGNDSTSFIPMRQRQRKDGAAIQDAFNEVDPLDWPSTEGNVVNEFKTDGLATMAFPTLFPYGKGDPTNRARQHGITLTEAFKHLIKFAEKLENGKFEWRFASHPRFPYWALNMKQRHQLLSQANIYLRQHPADANMTMEELKEMVNSMSANQMVNRLQRYVSKVQGTNQYWYQRLQELLALIEQKGCPTFFFTFSAADSHWPDLQRLLQNNDGATRTERAQAVIDNPHLTDWFFMQRLEEFIRHWLNGVMDAEWFWYRFEYQARGSIHAHGCAKLKNDPDIRLLRNHACLAFLENETSRHEMSPDDFEFFCQGIINRGEDAEKLLIQ